MDLQDEGVMLILRLVELVVKIGNVQVTSLFRPLLLLSLRYNMCMYYVMMAAKAT